MDEIKDHLKRLKSYFEQGNFCYAELLNQTMQLTDHYEIESIINVLSEPVLIKIRKHSLNLIELAENLDKDTRAQSELWIFKIDEELDRLHKKKS